MRASRYNYRHFGPQHVVADAIRALTWSGPAPGTPAPDFALPTTDGRLFRLSDLRGMPVLLRFGSFT